MSSTRLAKTGSGSLRLFNPTYRTNTSIEAFIQDHPVTRALRANPKFTESRPHLNGPAMLRDPKLLAGSLAGTQKLSVPPYVFNETNGKRMIVILHVEGDGCSHPGIIHGGLITTLIDDTFCRCRSAVLPKRVGVTANLNVDFRKPALTQSYIVLKAEVTRMEGRKSWVEGSIETLELDGGDPSLLAEAKALFIQPKETEGLGL
ncbi:hypothetical protein PENANT_c025G11672 [Penicillium antarcticum]|uniref:Thioesterase domain-containing protein n=1 Tax=Penicillium antarcticum TaxID=416450 RepID=A0A1V6PYP0_9EURO|nr:uncharacterized protein N7508_000402 [Penicillium antarcticum]KAJ5320119.1 hypothetical protein N7508_000402 [Penicillium antarcticum]OQD81822.1 hypothetical protein PENANT_c025G11672 [Penicillium antarcticum]